MLAISGNKLFQAVNLCAIRSLHQLMFNGEVPNTSATVSCLWWAMLYKQGYCSRNIEFLYHLSSQNLTCVPSLIMKVPNRRNSCFAFIRLAQKCEFPFLHWTCESGLEPRYLLRSISCQVPSVASNLKSHLLSNAVFLISKSWIPRSPWSLGWHKILHLARRYSSPHFA